MMMISKLTLAAAATAAVLAGAAPAQAVITTFASFNAGSTGNIVFANNATNNSNNNNYRGNGTGGTFFTTSSAANVRPDVATYGSVATSLQFLQAQLLPLGNLSAAFTLLGTVTNTPAVDFASPFAFQQNISGNFNFAYTGTAFTYGSVTINPGDSLLSGSFTQLSIIGAKGATSVGAAASTSAGGTITFASPFLSFAPTVQRDLSFSITSLLSRSGGTNLGLNFQTGRALRSFRATATGSFSTDPAPIVTAIPEPAVWGLMIVGFGMVGIQSRRRKSVAA